MRRATRFVVLCLSFAMAACGHSIADAPISPPSAPCTDLEVARADGCYPKLDDCGELAVPIAGGGCTTIGVPTDGCAPNLPSDGSGGCAPVLPEASCPKGTMAVPGDATCRPIASCGTDPFGDVPLDAATVYVDASSTATTPDGSRALPFPTVQKALDVAGAGATIAIAAGTYAEDLELRKPVRLLGRCPSLVAIVGQSKPYVLGILATAEVRRIAIRGNGVGIAVAGVTGVVLDELWIHDSGSRGLSIEHSGSGTEATIRRSLLESNRWAGISVLASKATVEATEIRDTLARATDATFGQGVVAQPDTTGKLRANVTIRKSLVSGNRTMGISFNGTDATVEGSVIRRSLPRDSDGAFGVGIGSGWVPAQGSANVHVIGSYLAGHRSSIVHKGGTLRIERTVARDSTGDGIVVSSGEIALRDSLVDRASRVAVYLGSTRGTIAKTIVRDTQAGESGAFGLGIAIEVEDTTALSDIGLESALLLRNRFAGVLLSGSKLRVVGSAVRGTLAELSSGKYGDGIGAQAIQVGLTKVVPADLTIEGAWLDGNARAGVHVGASRLAIGSTLFGCNAFDLDVSRTFGIANDDGRRLEGDYELEDRGLNACGCNGSFRACQASANDLQPVVTSTKPS